MWHLTRVEALTVSSVTVLGGETVAPETIEAKVNDVLSGTYFRLIPYRFAPLLPKTEVTLAVRDIPRVKNVSVDVIDRTELVVVFNEYIPTALWCDTALSTTCLFVDHTGYAFTTAPELTGSALPRIITDANSPDVGTVTLAVDDWRKLNRTIERLQSGLDLYVTHVFVHDDVDSTYQLARGGTLKISNRLSVEETLVNLQTIFQNESFDHLSAGDFHYIDLRFGDKIFVAEEEWQDVATTTDEVVATTTPMIETTELETD
jgi:hypothetical protein